MVGVAPSHPHPPSPLSTLSPSLSLRRRRRSVLLPRDSDGQQVGSFLASVWVAGNEMAGRKETALDLAKFVDKGVQVKLTGGRQVTGTLKGYDQLLNLVLDEAVESERGSARWGGQQECSRTMRRAGATPSTASEPTCRTRPPRSCQESTSSSPCTSFSPCTVNGKKRWPRTSVEGSGIVNLSLYALKLAQDFIHSAAFIRASVDGR